MVRFAAPYLVMADWNMEPHELQASPWVDRAQGIIYERSNTEWTCNQGQRRMLDYVVGSPSLVDLLVIEASEGHPWTPHKGLHIRVKDFAEVVYVRRPLTPQRLPEQSGPTAAWVDLWGQAAEQVGNERVAATYWVREGAANEELGRDYVVLSRTFELEKCARAGLTEAEVKEACRQGLAG